jgi:gliding motility-associated-like protein
MLAQRPNIEKVRSEGTTLGSFVSIAGNGFSSDASKIVVTFGAANAKVLSASDNIIEALVPPGATYDYISVTNLSSGLTGHSADKFLLSFSGDGYDASRMVEDGQIDEDPGLFDLCTCDFDGDGLNDIATTNNSSASVATSITVYKNATPANAHSIAMQKFNDMDLNTGTDLRNITCGDLNGDGRPEIVIGKGGNTADRLFIFKNISANGIINFDRFEALRISATASTSSARRIRIADMDGDGRPEIIMTDQNLGLVHIFANKGVNNSITFSPENKIMLKAARPTFGLDVGDLNGDGKMEVVFGSANESDLFYAINKSTVGNLAFDTPVRMPVSGTLTNLQLADFDNDGDKDIAVVNYEKNIYLLINQTTGSSVSFSSPKYIETNLLPWGLDVGDLNGDGKADIVIATRESGRQPMTALINKSNLSSISFTPYDNLGNAGLHVNVKVADFNGDGKPDVSYVTDDRKLGFIRNKHCVLPSITPANPAPICNSKPVELNATRALKVDYVWKKIVGNTEQVVSGADAFRYETNAAASYKAGILSSADGCSYFSGAVTVVTGGNSLPPKPVISAPAVICEGKSATLSTASLPGINYYWRKPDGTISTGNTVSISNAKAEDAGRYALALESSDGCRTEPVFALLQISTLPAMEISTSLGEVYCEGTSNVLSAPLVPLSTYSWKYNNLSLSNQSTYQIQVANSGTYDVSVKNQHGCTAESKPITIKRVQRPVAKFADVESSCLSQDIQFNNTSTFDTSVPVFFEWNFGDNTFSQDKSPTHRYTSAGTYTVSLNVHYADRGCADTYEYVLNISKFLGLNIAANGNAVGAEYEWCAGSALILSVDAKEGEVKWSTGSTSPQITVSEAGTYTVTSAGASGCASQDALIVKEIPGVDVRVISGDQRISRGGSAQLGADGAPYYSWEPAESLDNSKIASPLATPDKTTQYVVTGTNNYGCSDKDSLTVYMEGGAAIQIDAPVAFSPNGDSFNNVWEFDQNNLELIRGCPIKIMNRYGQTVYEANEYANDWDGTYNGKNVPEGAYYYIITCTNNEVHTGSVTLAR